jgi:hypothetical protein
VHVLPTISNIFRKIKQRSAQGKVKRKRPTDNPKTCSNRNEALCLRSSMGQYWRKTIQNTVVDASLLGTQEREILFSPMTTLSYLFISATKNRPTHEVRGGLRQVGVFPTTSPRAMDQNDPMPRDFSIHFEEVFLQMES